MYSPTPKISPIWACLRRSWQNIKVVLMSERDRFHLSKSKLYRGEVCDEDWTDETAWWGNRRRIKIFYKVHNSTSINWMVSIFNLQSKFLADESWDKLIHSTPFRCSYLHSLFLAHKHKEIASQNNKRPLRCNCSGRFYFVQFFTSLFLSRGLVFLHFLSWAA